MGKRPDINAKTERGAMVAYRAAGIGHGLANKRLRSEAFQGTIPSRSKEILKHDDHTIGLAGAFEMVAATTMLDDAHNEIPIHPNDYNMHTLERIGDDNIVVICLPSGVYGTSSVATVAIQVPSSFRSIQFCLMMGIGGEVPSRGADIRLGDTTVSELTSTSRGVVQYNYGKTVREDHFERTGTLNKLQQVLLTAVAKLQTDLLHNSRISAYLPWIVAERPITSSSLAHHGQQQDRLFQPSSDHVRSRSAYDGYDAAQATNDPMVPYGVITCGSDALDRTYEEAMERIKCQDENSQKLATHVLSWITYAKRPLKTRELRHALAAKVGEAELGEENIPAIQDMVSACAGLVTVDEESDIIRLVHYATREYFERTQITWFADAEVDIATTCITYLSFNAFKAGFCSTDEEFEERLRLNPFYDYAARYWGNHACAASIEADQLVLGLLSSEAKVSSCSQAMLASRQSSCNSGYSQRVPKQMRGAHLAAYFGLRGVIIALAENGHDLNAKNTFGRTPLSYAAERGHEVVVKQLLTKDGIDPNSKDRSGQTPLSCAAEKGREAVVKLLLAKVGIDLDSKDYGGRTPLSYAAEKGYEAVVKLLLTGDGINSNSKDYGGRTPLMYAAEKGHEAVVKLLLAKVGIDPDSKDYGGRTPLSYAAEKGHEAVVKLLLTGDGIDSDSKDYGGRTPLLYAAEKGHEAVVKLLLTGDGIDSDSKDYGGRTPLLYAAEKGHEAVVKLMLVCSDVKINSKDSNGRTPLWWAVVRGHDTVVKLLLLENGVDVNAQGSFYGNALQAASERGHEKVVRMLLENGADVNAQGGGYGNALQTASERGHEKVVQMLLENGADVNTQGGGYGNALQTASERGHEKVVQMLLENGADVNAQGSGYGNALQTASERGYEKVVQILLENGVDVNAQGGGYSNALQTASERGHKKVVQALLKKGADVNAQSGGYGNALQAASKGGHEEVVQVLLENGADVNAQGGWYGNALQAASKGGHERVVRMLLKNGADANVHGSYYGNTLQTTSLRNFSKRKAVEVAVDRLGKRSKS
ncbi:ankyrin [Zopfia rhizophila CBS 207.26]|uniref:Ankyrin n=1 Tax=Zopfia rhizophila CBS 207.26 TaxID=1314779 RepID=A0A6A6D879_9PEZI|nr:ankyrin [Zopfia rhizophila CBS 207.26]